MSGNVTAREEPEQCNSEGCTNKATPGDHRGKCLTCNPFGDSDVMNNSPAYLSWLFRPLEYDDGEY